MPLTKIKIQQYTAVLNQINTQVPNANVLINTLELPDGRYSRFSTGIYKINTTGLDINTNNSTIEISKTTGANVWAYIESNTSIVITTYDGTNPVDSELVNTPLTIKKYN